MHAGVFLGGGVTEEEDLMEDLGVSGRIILKCIFWILGGAWTGLIWIGLETRDGMLYMGYKVWKIF